MDLKNKVGETLKGGQKFDMHKLYLALYKEVSGKDYPHSKCTGCANRYLFRYLKGWYDTN